MNLINGYLKLKKQTEGKLNEIKTIAGKCYVCENKHVFDLLQHFKQQHCLTINSKCFEKSCLICGSYIENRKDLVAHQFEVHRIVTFVSLNKVFTLSKYENFDVEKKKAEEKLKELRTAAEIFAKNVERAPAKIESLTIVENSKNKQKVIIDSKSNYKRPNTISAITTALEAEKSQAKSQNIEGSNVSVNFFIKPIGLFLLFNRISFFIPYIKDENLFM